MTQPETKIGTKQGNTTVDPEEIGKFTGMAEEWWDPAGKFRPLHKFNPVRLEFIRHTVCRHFSRNHQDRDCLKNLRLLDIGCGGGLVAEPMARAGADVVAIDPVENNIRTAMAHALPLELDIDYRATTVEALEAHKEPLFDVILNLEVVEHVACTATFLGTTARLLRPGGIMVVATINRTLKALLLAKIGAEYILRWLPAGTHDPRKFVKPDEIRTPLEQEGVSVSGMVGVSYSPFSDSWNISGDLAVNYMLTACRPAE